MIHHSDISDAELRTLLKGKKICFGGNQTLKIYGLIKCPSGKRMKRKNRVFFASEKEARQMGYRPCGHCMNKKYKHWKNGLI